MGLHPQSSKLDALTSSRFFAALGVVVFHFGLSVWPVDSAKSVFSYANIAVSYFFCLSGFVLTFVYGQRSSFGVLKFYVARFARVAPIYYVALLLVVVFHWKQGILDVVDLALGSTFLQSWVPGRSQGLNSPGWSLSNEWCFYLSFPFLLAIIAKVRSGTTILVIAAGAWAGSLALELALPHYGVPEDVIAYHPIMHLGTFILGMVSGQFFLRYHETAMRVRYALAILPLPIGVVLLGVNTFASTHYHNSLFAPLFCAQILGLAMLSGTKVCKPFEHPLLVHLGEISYGVYILQLPVWLLYRFAMSKVNVELTPAIDFWAYVLVLLGCSHVAYKVIEVPTRDFINGAFKRRLAKSPA